MAKTIAFKIEIQGQERLIQNTQQLRDALRDVNQELANAELGSDEYRDLERAQSELINTQQRLRNESRDARNELRASGRDANVAEGSYEQLSARLSVLSARWRAMGKAARESLDGQRLEREIEGVTRELSDLDERVGRFSRNVGNYQSAFKNLGAQFNDFVKGGFIIAGVTAAIAGIEQLGQAIVSTNAEISDSLADVQRTAQLTGEEANNLLVSLKALDTRTSLDDLLGLANIGGKLGVPKAELQGFTKALDDINVALGGELGGDVEEVATQLGKLNTIFKVEGEDTGDKISKIGNAIIDLANKGTASGPFLTDFSQRLAGISGVAGITLGQSLGLGAGFEELGQSSEVAGTAVTQLVLKLGTDVPKFARLAGKSAEEFGKTLNANPVEALIQLSEGLTNNKTGLEEMSKAFAESEAKGVRVGATLGVLGKNADTFRQKISEGTEALTKTDKITEAVAIKQKTLGAELEKLGNTFIELFVTSGITAGLTETVVVLNEMIEGIGNLINPLDALGKEYDDLTGKVGNLEQELPKLLSRYDELKNNTNRSKEEQQELNDTIQQIAELTPTAITAVDAYGNALDISASKSRAFLEAEKSRLAFTNKELINGITSEINALSERSKAIQKIVTGESQPIIGSTSEQTRVRFREELRGLGKEVEGMALELARISGKSVEQVFQELGIAIPENLKGLIAFTGPVIPKELQKILEGEGADAAGKGGKKAGEEASKAFIKGSIGYLQENIGKLEKQLQNIVDPAKYVKVSEKIKQLVEQLGKTERGFSDALVTAAGGSLDLEALPQQVGDIASQVDTILKETGLAQIDFEAEKWEKIREISEKNAQDAADKQKEINQQKNEDVFNAELDLQANLANVQINAFRDLAILTAEFLQSGQQDFKEYFKGFLIILLDAIQATIVATRAAALATSTAFSPIGVIKYGIETAAIAALFQVAKAVINGFEGGHQAEHATGYTGQGSRKEIAGYVHRDEEVIPAGTLHHPKAAGPISQLRKISRELGYRQHGGGFENGKVVSIASPATGAIILKTTVGLSPGLIEQLSGAVKSGSMAGTEQGSMEGTAKAARQTRARNRKAFAGRF